MWSLLRIEIRYQFYILLWIIVVALGVVLVSALLRNYSIINFTLSYSAFITPYFVFINANKENRNRRYATLPIALRHIALYRIVLVIFSMAMFGVLYWLLQKLILKSELAELRDILLIAGLTLFIYGISYIYRDLFREFILRKGITREKVAPVLILIAIILQLAILAAFLQAKAGNNSGFHIGRILDWLITHFPFRGQAGHINAFIVGNVLGIISIFTFERSKVRY